MKIYQQNPKPTLPSIPSILLPTGKKTRVTITCGSKCPIQLFSNTRFSNGNTQFNSKCRLSSGEPQHLVSAAWESGTSMEDNTKDPSLKKNDLWAQLAWDHLQYVRQASPLIQCITNFVSMDIVANVLLAAGASPAMTHSVEEIRDFTPKISGLYVNAGTLTPDFLSGMKLAVQVACENNKPWVLDPVAAGGSDFRLKACTELLKLKPTVVRGNGSEIVALFKGSVDKMSKGVDSTLQSTDAVEAAKSLAQMTGSVVAVSGAVDIITDGIRVVGVKNGVPLLQKITATGCSVTSLITAFVAMDVQNPFEATATALSVFGLAGEIGADMAQGPASLRTHLIDALHGLNQDAVLQRVNISNI